MEFLSTSTSESIPLWKSVAPSNGDQNGSGDKNVVVSTVQLTLDWVQFRMSHLNVLQTKSSTGLSLRGPESHSPLPSPVASTAFFNLSI